MDIESVKEKPKPKRKSTRKKKEPVENFMNEAVYYGHGAGKLMRMRKAGYTMAQIRAMK